MSKGYVLALLLGLGVAPLAQARAESGKETEKKEEVRRLAAPVRGSFATSREASGLFSGLGVGMFAAASGDAASTEWGLSRAGVYEANPLMRSRAVRIGTHVAVPAAMWWASDYLYNKGERKLAWAMRIGVVAAYGYATLHNVRTVSGLK